MVAARLRAELFRHRQVVDKVERPTEFRTHSLNLGGQALVELA